MTFSQSRAELSCQIQKEARVAAARALHPRSSGPSLPRARGRGTGSRSARITQPEPRSVLRPGPTGLRLSEPEAQGQRASPAAAGGYRPVPSPGLRGPPAAAAPVLRGAGRSGGRAAAGPEGFREWRGSHGLQCRHPVLLSRTLPITLTVGFPSLPPPTGARAGAAQRKRIRGRQLRPALAKQPPGRDGERPGLGIRDEVGFPAYRDFTLLVPRTQLPLRLPASWPGRALPPRGRAAAPGARHCGGCSPGMRKKRHVLLARPHLLWIRTTPLRSNQRAFWS